MIPRIHFLFMTTVICISYASDTPLKDSINGSYIVKEDREVIFSVEEPFRIVEYDISIISWISSVKGVEQAVIQAKNEYVSFIINHEEFFHKSGNFNEYISVNLSNENDATVSGYFNMSAGLVGFNQINVTLFGAGEEIVGSGSLTVAVLLQAQTITKIYSICLTIMLIIVYINMGANLDLVLVKRIVTQPIGPAIGLFCQFVCMPLISFALGLLLFPEDPLLRLGLFASGSSPGGGFSNMWTHLLGGSLDLSIMMTFASTVAALGTVPFWLLTLGPVILNEASFVIPYANVVIGIVVLIVPCFIGILIQLKFPKVTKIMKIILSPLSIFNILFIFSFGTYCNAYLFSYITWKAVLAGFGQSILGHLAGILFAVMCRRPRKEVIAISIETAVQNNGVAFLLLKMSLDSPAGDLAVLMPGCVALFIPLILLHALLLKTIFERFFSKGKATETSNMDNIDKQKMKSIKANEIKEKEKRMNEIEEKRKKDYEIEEKRKHDCEVKEKRKQNCEIEEKRKQIRMGSTSEEDSKLNVGRVQIGIDNPALGSEIGIDNPEYVVNQ